MNLDFGISPYGGRLIELMAGPERAGNLKEMAVDLPDITLNDRQLCDYELLATGALSPLNGFMTRKRHESVLDRMRLEDGTFWPIPVCLDVAPKNAEELSVGGYAALRDPEGFMLAVMRITDIWPVSPEKEAELVYGSQDRVHPGVDLLFRKKDAYYAGGDIEALSLPLHYNFRQLRMSPAEVRVIFRKLGWQRIVGFHTRGPIHRPQFEMTLEAMRRAKANLLILPGAGVGRPADFDHFTRMRCYRAVARHYPPDTHMMSILPMAARMAGPREALLHSIIARNYGCTHFIVGHDHAGPGCQPNGQIFYCNQTTRELVQTHQSEIGVDIMTFRELVYLPFEDEFRPKDQVADSVQRISLQSADIRERIRSGRRIPDWFTFPEVVEELTKAFPPPRRQGITVFFTGLSGAGKSTIAKILYSRFLEIGERPVTLLDGDIVRLNLSRELTFSREHRDINVRRIGFVASEITKNRGIAICAPIAPFSTTRREIREIIETYGGFIEVHVATPLKVCEKRDRKGMYAKARAGLITGFTGVDDPYEPPESPEVRIDTTNITPEEAVQEILLYLGQRGYI